MKYVRTFESFRNKKTEPVNEELLGGLINFFKNMWNKATEELKKLGEKPTTEQLDNWVENNVFNPSSGTYLFKSVLEEFKKKTEANNEDCLKLVDDILDPQTGALGSQGLQPLYDGLSKVFGNDNRELETIKFYFETARNRAIKDYKFAGGPDLKVGEESKVNPEAKKMDLTDKTHLPDLKKILQGSGEDNKKKKESTSNWVSKNLIPTILKYIKEIKPEEIKAYLDSKGIKQEETTTEEYKVGDVVVYKRDKFNEEEWKSLSDDEKKKPEEGKMKELQNEQIGIKEIKSITGEEVGFEDAEGKPFKKTLSDILMKSGDKSEEAKKAAESLGKIKDDPEKMKTVADIADILQDDTKKDQIDQIKKIVGGETA